jgi:hypothetical protein
MNKFEVQFVDTGLPRYSQGYRFREIWIREYQNRYLGVNL